MFRNLLKVNSIFISLLFFPTIYLSGWVLINFLVNFLPFLDLEKSLYGTIITFILFLFFLPSWSKNRWSKNLFKIIKVQGSNKKNLICSLFFEFLKALVIIFIFIFLLIKGNLVFFSINLNENIILNSLFLGAFVGIAEELVFRVWLFEELNLFFSAKRANLYQAILFSLVHYRHDYNLISNFLLFIGLFLLGLYLNTWRLSKNPSILLPVLFHGSLVGVWFLLNNSLTLINKIPSILFGPGNGVNINPIGGLAGIIMLFLLNIFQKRYISKYNF